MYIVDIGFIVSQIFMMSLKQMTLLVCAIYIIVYKFNTNLKETRW